MKAISLWQPWASLWARGRKRNETRSWYTKHRGLLLIHASKTMCTDVDEQLRAICEAEFGSRWMTSLPLGALIGSCDVVKCLPTESVIVDAIERAQGNFDRGRFAWEAASAREFATPLPYRGRQQLFDVPDAEVAEALGIIVSAADPAQAKLL
jgi:hypothetical protein